MSLFSPADVFAAFFAGHQPGPEPGMAFYGPCGRPAADADQPVPYTLTPQAEAALDAADPEPEAEP